MATLKKVAEEFDELREFGEWLDLDQKQRAADPLTANLADRVWLLKALQRYEHYLGPPETTGHTSSAKLDPKKAARSMFELADRFDSNGELTLAEMHTFLSHDLECDLHRFGVSQLHEAVFSCSKSSSRFVACHQTGAAQTPNRH